MTSLEKILLDEDAETLGATPDTTDGVNRRRFDSQIKKREILYFAAAEVGDLNTVRRIVYTSPHFNVDCVDALGRTALRLAVKNGHVEIVVFLLDCCSLYNVYESLLVSIRCDDNNISEIIIRHPKYAELQAVRGEEATSDSGDSGGGGGGGGSGGGFDFQHVDDTLASLDVTPLMLAAQRNQYEIVHLLLKLGEEIPEPHDDTCSCDTCVTMTVEDGLRHARARLNAYRALCSPAYITLSSRQNQTDPILTAFHLYQTLQKIANTEKHYRAEYLNLAAGLGDFETSLIDRVRNDHELEILLNQKDGGLADAFSTLARLKLAIYCGRKQFVAHAYCQKKLISEWHGSLTELKNKTSLQILLHSLLLLLLYPILALIYIIAPRSKVGRFLQVPIIKFFGQVYSNVIFVLLIMLYSLREKATAYYLLSDTDQIGQAYESYVNMTLSAGEQPVIEDVYLRYHGLEVTAITMALWVLGLVFQECTELFRLQLSYYYDSLFNLLDFLYQALYVTSFTLRYLVVTKVTSSLDYFSSPQSWSLLHQGDDTARQHAYWLTADRYYWDSADPLVVSEALFSAANVISLCRVGTFLIVSEKIGPMLISLYRMLLDLGRFMVFFVIFILAFVVGFLNLYWYYAPEIRQAVETIQHPDLVVNAENQFSTFDQILKTVYWALFGMAELESVEIGDYAFSSITTGMGYILFSIYNWVTIIILINILIAMMARSYEIITEDQDVEWKFSRSKIYLDYIGHLGTLPPPMNLLPSTANLIRDISRLCCCRWSRKYPLDDTNRTKDGSMMLTQLDPNAQDEGKGVTGSNGETNSAKGARSKVKVSGVTEDTSVTDANTSTRVGTPGNGNQPKTNGTATPADDGDSTSSEFSIIEEFDEYGEVMHNILRRYLVLGHGSSEVSNTAGTSEDPSGVETLQKDLANLRYELVGMIRQQAAELSGVGQGLAAVRTHLREESAAAQSRQKPATHDRDVRITAVAQPVGDTVRVRTISPSSGPENSEMKRFERREAARGGPSPRMKRRQADDPGEKDVNMKAPSGGASLSDLREPSGGMSAHRSPISGTPLDSLFDRLADKEDANNKKDTIGTPRMKIRQIADPTPMRERTEPAKVEKFDTVRSGETAVRESGIDQDGRRYRKITRTGGMPFAGSYHNIGEEDDDDLDHVYTSLAGRFRRMGSASGPHSSYGNTISSFGIGSDFTPGGARSRTRHVTTYTHKKI